MYRYIINQNQFTFPDLKTLLAKATPIRSGDLMQGIAATSLTEMVAAQCALAEVPLKHFLQRPLIQDEITDLIHKQHNANDFLPISHYTVGELRDHLLSYQVDLPALRYALTPEMVAAVSKLMRNQDLIAIAKRCEVVTRFRNTLGLAGHFSTRLQPNDPTDDLYGIMNSLIEGFHYWCGDAVVGVNPATNDMEKIGRIIKMLDKVRNTLKAPIQSCVLTHITITMELAKAGFPVDLFFQSLSGTQTANESFGINLALLHEAHQLALSLNRGTLGTQCMYFETGQGNALSSQSHHGIDQQTIETRAYALAREFDPLIVNTVVGFIGPEYLFDGKQIIRAGLEDHFCGKILGLPMGVDVCYTNHCQADQNDMDILLTLLATAGCNFVMAVPGADDVMLNYQSTSYHDAMYVRQLLKLPPSPEFTLWLQNMGLMMQDSPYTLPNKEVKLVELGELLGE